ncbi:MAG: sensor histidine kinase [Thermoplasmatota archaeon]
MKRWLILLLLVPVATSGPQHEAAILEAHVDATFHPNLDPASMREIFDVLPAGQGSSGEGCHHAGTFRYEPGKFQFQEQREESGCGEVQLEVDIPEGVDEIGIRFLTNRVIDYSSQDERLQLTPDNPQRLRIYDERRALVQEFTVYQDRAPHAAADVEYAIVVPTDDLGRNMTLGWYFEDTGSGLAPLVGSQTGRQFTARVHDVRITLRDLPVDMAPPETVQSIETNDVILDTMEARVTIPANVAGPDAWLTVRHLGIVMPERVWSPNGTLIDDFEQIVTGTQHQLRLQAAEAGTYVVAFSGSTPVPIVPPPPPTRIPWLLVAALSLCGALYVTATTHQGLFYRDHAQHQRRTAQRKNVEIALLGLTLSGLTGYTLATQRQAMTTLPIEGVALGLYALLAIFGLLCIIHLGIGVLRRSYARELRHAEEVEQANAVLARSNRDLEQFAYVASHDLQEPLRKVASFTSLLDRRYEDALDDRGRKYVHNAHDAAVRARQLIRDLLAFSRIGQDHPKEPTDLNDVLRDVRQDLAASIRQAHASVVVEELPTIDGSPSLLQQLFTNLVGNAIKYRHPDRHPEVHIVATKGRHHWTIHVRDNGLGIAKEHQAQVFQIFQRLHGRGSQYEGSGIGLAICQRITEFHGGEIGLTSKADVGSDFYVTFPIRRADG